MIEQVVGYSPTPAKNDIVSSGIIGSEVDPDSIEGQEAKDSSIRQLTKKRQQQLDNDDTVDAETTGQQLQDLTSEGKKMKITKRQLQRIIAEEKQKLLEMEDRYGGDQNYREYRETEDKLLRLLQNMTPQGRQAVTQELIGIIDRYAHKGYGGGY